MPNSVNGIEVLEPELGRMVAVNLTGQVFAVTGDDGYPVLLDLPGLGACLALFGNVADLRDYLGRIGVTGYRIKQVDDGPAFLTTQIPWPVVCNMRFDAVTNMSKWKLVKPLEQA